MKKRYSFGGSICLIFLLLLTVTSCGKSKYQSESVYVYNLTEGKEVLDYYGKSERAPASLVKIMTVYLGLEEVSDLSAPAPVDIDAYRDLIARNASMAGFVGKESTTYRDLFYGTILASGGECADSLALHIGGSEEAFVEKMNARAKELGLTHTTYKNVEGLDVPGQVSTARDIAKLLTVALQDGNFRKIFTTETFTSSPTPDHPEGVKITSTVLGKLHDYPQDGFQIIGGKSGTTDEAGLCWATLAEKNGKEYIVVVMGAPFESGDGQIQDTLEILREL